MATRKKKTEPAANTIMDFVTDAVEVAETTPVFVPKPKPPKVNGDDYFLVKVKDINGASSSHPVAGWKLSSWLKFYEKLNSITSVSYELSSKEAYDVWMYSPIEDDEVEPVVKKVRKKNKNSMKL
jgi:hypothetical protein